MSAAEQSHEQSASSDESIADSGVRRRHFLAQALITSSVLTAAGMAAPGDSEAATAEDTVRGSEKLLQRLGGAGMTISKEELGKILDIAKKHKVKIPRWCQYGQPAVDGICGTFELGGRVGNLIDDLLQLNVVQRVHVFPYGIPVPDVFRVDIQAGLG
jgi:hypothetical protein